MIPPSQIDINNNNNNNFILLTLQLRVKISKGSLNLGKNKPFQIFDNHVTACWTFSTFHVLAKN